MTRASKYWQLFKLYLACIISSRKFSEEKDPEQVKNLAFTLYVVQNPNDTTSQPSSSEGSKKAKF